MKLAGILTLLAVVLALSPSSMAADAPTADATRLVTLKNGMRVLLAPDTSSVAVDVGVWYRTGTGRETTATAGIPYLFEQLLSAGSAHYGPGERERLIHAEGGSTSAVTTPDHAWYGETVPPGALELALRLEADRIAAPTLTDDAVAQGKRAMRLGQRWHPESALTRRALQSLFRLGWTVHPYHGSILGSDEANSRITLADCQAYQENCRAPNGALVTIVGNFDAKEALQLAKRWLEPLKRRRVAAAAPPVEPAQKGERRAYERMDVPLPMLAVGWKVPARSDPDRPAFALLARILLSGQSSRLQRALVTGRSRALMVNGGLESRRDGGLLYAVVGLRSAADSAAVESTLVAGVEELAREPVGQAELDRARRQDEIETLLSWQPARGRAQALGTALLDEGDYRAADRALERVRQLTPADLQRAAARVLRAAGRNVVWISPEKAQGVPPVELETPDSGTGSSPAEGGR